MAISYMTHNGNGYYLQKRIPKDMLPHYPDHRSGLIKRYLDTDLAEAKRKLAIGLAELEAEWTAKRKGGSAVELSDKEIERLTAICLHNLLDEDEQLRMEGLGSEELHAVVTWNIIRHGVRQQPNFMPKPVPAGLSDREYAKISETIDFAKDFYGDALSKGRTDVIEEELDDLLKSEGILISKKSPSYRKLAFSILKASVKAAEVREFPDCVDGAVAVYLNEPPDKGTKIRSGLLSWLSLSLPFFKRLGD